MGTTTGSNNFQPKHSVAKQLGFVLLGAALILLIPAVAMQFTSEVNWGLGDFIAAAVLLVGTGSAYVLVASKMASTRSRVMAGAALGFMFLLIWAELAVGIFD